MSWGYLPQEQEDVVVTPSSISGAAITEITSLRANREEETIETPYLEVDNGQEVADTVASEEDKILTKENNESSGTYQEMEEGIDIEYEVHANSVKENIVLNKPTSVTEYRFQFYTKTLKANINKDGVIEFTNKKNKVIYTIPAGIMYDSAEQKSNEVTYRLEKSNKGYILTVIPNQQWLNAPERVYPVTVDPTVISVKNMIGVTKSIGKRIFPTDFDPDFLRVGVDTYFTTFTSYIQFNSLPMIGLGSKIMNASLMLHPDTVDSDGNVVYLRDVSNIEDINNDNWNCEYGDVVSCGIINKDNKAAENPCEFDITKLVETWYNVSKGVRGGLELSSPDALFDFVFCNNPTYLSLSPYLSITFRSAEGLENYWSYQSQDIGRAGTGYVNTDYGSLTLIENDISMNGNRLPISVSHVYNSTRATEQPNGSSMQMGYGWRLGVCQTIQKVENLPGYEYVLTDGDGTKHYFSYKVDSSTEYEDEDGLGLTLSIVNPGNEQNYKVVDKANNVMMFDRWSYLQKITDANNNVINYNYDFKSDEKSRFLKNITDSSGRKVEFYYRDNLLDYIIDASSRITKFTYVDGYLVQITYPDGKISKYEYLQDCEEKPLNKVTNCDGYSVQYEYSSNYFWDYKVAAIKQLGSDGTEGESISSIDYGLNRTTFRDNKGRVIKYIFDNSGHTINVLDDKGNAIMYDYYASNDSSKQKRHKIKQEGSMVQSVYNLAENGSFEDNNSTSWNHGRWIYGAGFSINGTTSIDGSNSYYGGSAFKVVHNESTFGRIFCSQSVTGLQQDKKYTLSGYLKTDNISNVNGGGAELFVKFLDAQGMSISLTEGEFVNGSTNDWERRSVTFTVPKNTARVVICAGLTHESGTVWFDGIQLEKGEAPNPYNLIDNPSFERNNGATSMASNWVNPTNFLYNDGENNASVANSANGSWAMKITGEPDKRKHFAQAVNVKGKEGDVFSLSGWAKANAISGHDFKVSAAIIYDTNYVYWVDGINFSTEYSDWQYASGIINTKDPAGSHGNYVAIHIYVFYNNQCNTARFDGIQLIKDNAQSYVYDDNGNLISTADAAKSDASFAYSNNNLSKMVNPDGTSYEYEYDANKNVTVAKSSEGVKYGFTYDSNGNALTSDIYSDSNSTSIVSGKTYYIRNKNSGKYMDVWGSDESGAGIYQGDFSGEKDQQFRVVNDGGYYKITPLHSLTGKVVDVFGGTNEDGIRIELYHNYGSSAQRFKIIPNAAGGTYRIASKCSNGTKCIEVPNLSYEAGMPLFQQTYKGGANQEWYFEPVKDAGYDEISNGGVYNFRNALSGQYLDVFALFDDNGTGINQHYFNGGKNQQFRVTNLNSSVYKIQPLHSMTGKAVDVWGALTTDNAMVNIMDDNGDSSQQYNFVRDTDGTYQIQTGCTGYTMSLDVLNATYSPGAQIVQYTNNSSRSQRWILEKVSERISTASTYTSDGNYMSSVTDASGNATSYDYGQSLSANDYNKGLLRSVTDATGSKTSYNYDFNSDELLSVSKPVGGTIVSNVYQYRGDYLFLVKHNGFDYKFIQDNFGKLSSVSVGTPDLMGTLVSYTYEPNNGNLSKVTYGNRQEIGYKYDEDDQLREITDQNDITKFKYTYDYKGNLYKNEDFVNNITYQYDYDMIDRPTKVTGSNGHTMTFGYDEKNRLSNFSNLINGSTNKTSYLYGDSSISFQKPGLLYGIKNNDTKMLGYEYDALSRLKTKTLYGALNYKVQYEFKSGSKPNTTTTLLNSIQNGNNAKISYTYDANGNIKTISEGGVQKVAYTYDELNELKREDNLYLNRSIAYFYNKGGNLTGKWEYAYTTGALNDKNITNVNSYQYDDTSWNDLLTRFRGVDITYDDSGNPKNYRDKLKFDWQNGRELKEISRIGTGLLASYQYNEDGIRTSKTANGEKTTYYLNGSSIAGERIAIDYTRYSSGVTAGDENASNPAGEDETKAFDGNANTKWLVYKTTGTLSYTFPGIEKYAFNQYSLTSGNDEPSRDPKSWSFQASNDGTNWTTLDTKLNVTFDYQLQKKEFTCSNSTAYSRYRIVITQNNGSPSYTQLADFALARIVKKIDYLQDENGNQYGLKYNGVLYYYLRNGQNDVIGIINGAGKQVAYYVYDSWGKLVSIKDTAGTDITNDKSSIGYINPIRYRGYYYDNESGLYYLNSRYYDPVTCRMVNADDTDVLTASPMGLTDKNLFAYCDNNPVIRADDGGDFWFVIAGGVGAAIGGVCSAASQYASTGKINWKSVLVDTVAGAASGLLASTGVGLVGAIAGNAAISAVAYAGGQAISNQEIDAVDMAFSTVVGGVGGAIGGKGVKISNLEGAFKSSTNTLKTAVSPSKIAKYSAKKTAIKKTIKAAVKKTSKVTSATSATSTLNQKKRVR